MVAFVHVQVYFPLPLYFYSSHDPPDFQHMFLLFSNFLFPPFAFIERSLLEGKGKMNWDKSQNLSVKMGTGT